MHALYLFKFLSTVQRTRVSWVTVCEESSTMVQFIPPEIWKWQAV